MSAIDDLLDDIFDSQKTALHAEFEAWLRGSRRYQAFAAGYRAKIRAKLRNARDEAGLQDVRAELAIAALLLTEERFALEYEKYAAAKQRGPDFTVTFKTHTPFNVEVRRLRGVELDDGAGGARGGKLMAVVGDKVRQMPPSIVNLLWLVAAEEIAEADLSRAMAALRQRAEAKDEAFFTRRGFKSAADFLKQYRHLSGIFFPQEGENAVWLNPLARHKAPPEIVRAIQRLGSV